jgi:hypothetical protein
MDEQEAHRIVANFLTASAPLERHLQEGKPLTKLELESITLALDQINTFLNIWSRKHHG